MSFLYTTISQYDTAIAGSIEALERARELGQKHKNDSGGSSQEVEEVDLEKMESHLRRLQRERNDLICGRRSRGFSMRGGW